MSKSGMMAAVAAAAGLGAEQAENLIVDAKFIETHFPDVAKTFRDDGAKAEHDRILSIEAAAMPGHEAIISAHKADRSKTGADAALAVITAENKARAAAKASLDTDEEKLRGLRAATGDTAPEAPANANPHAQARSIAEQAQIFTAEQAAKGITVTPAQAVAHVSQKG